jgi:hypothetical protein
LCVTHDFKKDHGTVIPVLNNRTKVFNVVTEASASVSPVPSVRPGSFSWWALSGHPRAPRSPFLGTVRELDLPVINEFECEKIHEL